MKHAFRHFARAAVYLAPEGEESTGGGAVSTGRQPSAASQDRGIESIDAAMAELDRRDAERRQAKRADKRAAREEQVRTRGQRQQQDGDEGDDPDAEQEDADPRRVERDKKADKAKDKPEAKAKGKADASDDDGADDDESDDDAEGDADDEEASDDDAETRADDADADEDDDGEDQRPTSLDDATEVEIEHEGEKRKVTLKELREGYLRRDHFTRNSTHLAQERQTVQQAAAKVTEAMGHLQQQQQVMAIYAQAMLGDEPSLDLAQSDPTQYTVQKALYDQRQRALGTIRQHLAATQQQAQQVQQQQVASHTMHQLQALVQQVPELRDPKKREAFTRDVVEGAAKYGFTAQDVAAVNDTRMLLLLRDLSQLQRNAKRSERATEDVRKKLANVPPRQIKPGTASGTEGKSQKRAEARSKFMRSSRSIKDAMRVLNASD